MEIHRRVIANQRHDENEISSDLQDASRGNERRETVDQGSSETRLAERHRRGSGTSATPGVAAARKPSVTWFGSTCSGIACGAGPQRKKGP